MCFVEFKKAKAQVKTGNNRRHHKLSSLAEREGEGEERVDRV